MKLEWITLPRSLDKFEKGSLLNRFDKKVSIIGRFFV